MAEGRLAHDWARTSTVLALLANCHRDPKKTRAFRPDDFNPVERQRQARQAPQKTRDLSILKTVFVDNHRKASPQ